MHVPRAFGHAGRFLALMLSSVFLLGCAHAQAQPATPSYTVGEQKTAVILINYQDAATQPITVAAANNLVLGTVSNLFWEASYQRTFLSGDTYGWFTIPVSKSVCNVALIAQEADKAAAAAGIDLSVYQRVIYLGPDNACTVTGHHNGTAVPSRTWILTDNPNPYVVAHELGHNFGMSHSQSLDCGVAVLGDTCTSSSYGDAADTMGSGSTPHFNVIQKELLGWIGVSGTPAITTVSSSGSYRITPLTAGGSAATAIKIARGVDTLTGEMSYYYLEYRQPVGFDAVLGSVGNLTAGILIRTGGVNQYSRLLDMTPNSDAASAFNDVRDGALAVGRTYVDSIAGVSIKLVSADATGATIEVTTGGASPPPACARAAPAITLGGPTAIVAAGSTLAYTVSVVNRDSAACAATTFNLARSIPSGWSGTLGASSLNLSPGTSGNTTLTVTSATSATGGSYGIGVGAGSSAGSVHAANAYATYAVASASSDATLTETVGTDKASYLRGQTVYMSALVKSGGVVLGGANVVFRITASNGGVISMAATSGSDGYARASYRLGKGKGAIGSYALRADASSSGRTATASTAFSVN